MKIRSVNGNYTTSYFFVNMESDDSGGDLLLNNRQLFVHEYIHFLQDIFLPYNLRASIIEMRNFSLIASIASQRGFVRPFEDWDDDAVLTELQCDFTLGCDCVVNVCDKIVETKSKFILVEETGARVFKHSLVLMDGSEYHVGARDFLEYIAHKIEDRHWSTFCPDFPYRTVDFLFEYYELSVVPVICRIAIAEFCLHNDNPMNNFVMLVNWIKNGNVEKFLEYGTARDVLLCLQWNSEGGFSETMHSKTIRRLLSVRANINERFGGRSFYEVSKWLGGVVDYVYKNMVGRLFFSELYEMGSERFKLKIDGVIEEVGIPLIFNNKQECCSLLPSDYEDNSQFVQLYVASCFMDFIRTDVVKCPLFDFCAVSDASIMNECCSTNPISRGLDLGLCPVGQFVKSYDLHNIT